MFIMAYKANKFVGGKNASLDSMVRLELGPMYIF